MPDATRLLDLAQQLQDAGQFAAARQTLSRAVTGDPTSAQANDMMAALLNRLGEKKAALFYAKAAARLDPTNLGVQCDLASLRAETGDAPAAIETLTAITAAEPRFPRGHAALVAALLVANRIAEAEAAARRGLEFFPGDEDLALRLAACELDLAMPDRACATIARMRMTGIDNPKLAEYHATLANYASAHAPGHGPNTPEAISQLHKAVGTLIATTSDGQPRLAAAKPRARKPGEPLRIGIVSADLRRHSVATFFEPIAQHIDPSRITLHAYSLTPHEDAVSEQLKPHFARWRSCAKLTPREVDRAIRADGIDIALELGGYTGLFGLAALRDRPAPVQVTYLGYPNTTGCPFLDDRIIDAITDPFGTEPLATERLVRTEGCFLCYGNTQGLPPSRPRPSLAPGAPIIFGCYTVIAKVSESTLRLWSRVLHAVPGSRLVIKSNVFNDPATRTRIESWWREHGVPTDRLDLKPTHPSFHAHMDSYHDIHIALDPTPYNGTTTSCDALAMGTPVLAMRGPLHAARVSASILTHTGLPELVADDEDAYAALAASLAADRARLHQLHETIRARFLTGPVCDGPAFAARFASTLANLASR